MLFHYCQLLHAKCTTKTLYLKHFHKNNLSIDPTLSYKFQVLCTLNPLLLYSIAMKCSPFYKIACHHNEYNKLFMYLFRSWGSCSSLLLKSIRRNISTQVPANSTAETNKTHLDNLPKEKLNFQLLKFYMFFVWNLKTSTLSLSRWVQLRLAAAILYKVTENDVTLIYYFLCEQRDLSNI